MATVPQNKQKPLVRYLRHKADHSNIYIWSEEHAKNIEFEEVFARNVADAQNGPAVGKEGEDPDLMSMTKAQLMAFCSTRFDVELDPNLKHIDMVNEISALMAGKAASSDDTSNNAA